MSELVDFSQSTLADNEGIFWLLDAEACLSPVGELRGTELAKDLWRPEIDTGANKNNQLPDNDN